jgi:hypothetical protein
MFWMRTHLNTIRENYDDILNTSAVYLCVIYTRSFLKRMYLHFDDDISSLVCTRTYN